METQNVTPDDNGQYSVILGSTTATGLPDDLFSQQEQRWLGVQVQGQAEQARVLLVSVPYAFKAHEAETLGGLPASAFVKAPTTDAFGSGATGSDNGTSVNALSAVGNASSVSKTKGAAASTTCNTVTSSTGSPSSYIPMWGTNCNLVNSLMFQDPFATVVNDNGSFNLVFTSPFLPNPSYQIGGSPVLSISGFSAPLTTLSVGVNAGSGGQSNTFSGTGAGQFNFGNSNTFTGAFAGNNSGGFFFTDANTFTGAYAGQTSVGSNNVFSGYQAGVNSKGSNNTFSGYGSGFNNNASGNSFYGYQAGYSYLSTTATGNSFFGYQAGYSSPYVSNRGSNTYVGYQAGYTNSIFPFGNSAGSNTYVGYQAGYGDQVGQANTYIGYQAGQDVPFSKSENNIFIGFRAGTGHGGYGSNDIYIGNKGGIDEFDTIRIGTEGAYSTESGTYIAHIFLRNVGLGFPVYVNSDGRLGTSISCCSMSSRSAEQITDMGDSSSGLMKLRPVTFYYKPQSDDGSHALQYGLITEEVAAVYPELAVHDENGEPSPVNYQSLAPMLLNELQKQHTVVAAQQDVIKTQQEQIQTQGQRITDLQQRLSRLESLSARK